MLKRIISISIILSLLISTLVYADARTMSKPTSLLSSALYSGGDSNNQYTLTVNKDSNISSVTVKVGTATISPKTSGGNTYWVDKGSNPTISATANVNYQCKSGTGSVGMIESSKTVSVTSELKTCYVDAGGQTDCYSRCDRLLGYYPIGTIFYAWSYDGSSRNWYINGKYLCNACKIKITVTDISQAGYVHFSSGTQLMGYGKVSGMTGSSVGTSSISGSALNWKYEKYN